MSAPAQLNPYVGLRPFREDEGHLFFGRGQQKYELRERLKQGRLVAVVGSSGCGKSSLVRAGLIPVLKAGFLVKDRDAWQVAVMTPGTDPLRRLAAGLVAGGNGEAEALAARLREEGVEALIRQVKSALGDRCSLLLVVDQFEEVFGSSAAAGFISLILDLVDSPELPAFVALTMRSDFIGNCGRYAALAEALNRGLYVVPALTRDQRRESILGPADWAGRSVAPRLVDHLLNECDSDTDGLPVLQHALMRTWQRLQESGNESLDLGHFEKAGRFRNAIHNHAEETLEDALAAANGDRTARRALIARLFQALTEIDPGNRAIRRPAPISTLAEVTGASRDEVRQALEPFREQSFLVCVKEHDSRDNDLRVDLSHETLIRKWQTLKEWVEQEADSEAIYRRLVDAAVLQARGDADLYHGPSLQIALRWKQECQPNAPWARRVRPPEAFREDTASAEGAFPLVVSFLNNSDVADSNEKAQRAAEAAKAQRRRLRRIQLSWASGLLVLVSGLLGWRQHSDAQHKHLDDQRAEAHTKAVTEAFGALGLSMESGTRRRTSPWASLFLAAAGLRSTHELQERAALVGEADLSKVQSRAEAALRRALAGVSGGTIVAVQGKTLTAVVPDAEGRSFLTVEDDGAVREGLVRPPRPQGTEEMKLLFKSSNPGAGRTHLGTGAGWVASAQGKTVALWRREAPSNAVIGRAGSSVSTLAVGRKGKWLAIATEDGQVQLFDLGQGRLDHSTTSVRVGRAAVAHVRFSSDDRWLAAADREGGWGLWALSREGPRAVEKPKAPVSALDFDFASQRLLIATSKGVSVVDLRTGGSSHPSLLACGTLGIAGTQAPKIDDMQVSPDGRWLALRTQEGRLCVVALGSLGAGSPLSPGAPFGPREPGQSFAFTSDGRSLLLGGRDGIVSRWELPHVTASPGPKADDVDGPVEAVALSPDLTWQAIGTLQGKVKVRGIEEPGSAAESVRAGDTHALPPRTLALDNAIAAVKVSPDGRWLASLTRTNALTLWEVTGRAGLQRRTTEKGVSQVVIGGDGGRLVLGTRNAGRRGSPGMAGIRELTPAGLRPTFPLGPAEHLVLSRSGRFLVTRLQRGGVALWVANAFPPPAKPILLVENGAPATALTISARDGWLVAGTEAGEIRLWNLAAGLRTGTDAPAALVSGSEITLSGGKAPITTVAVSGDEQRLVTGDAEGIVRVYALPPRLDRKYATLAAHEGPVRAATLSTKGPHLLTQGEDRTLLWRIDRTDPVPQVIVDPYGPIAESAFGEDGSHLLTVTVTGSTRWWSLDPDQLLRDARAAVGRNLSEAEWTRLIPGVPFRQVFGDLP